MADDLVTLAEAKTYLNISDSTFDDLLNALIDYTTQSIESYCRRTWTQGSVTEYFDGGGRDFAVSTPPIDSITTITDTEDSSVVDSDDYDYNPVAGLIYLSDTAPTIALYGNSHWGEGRRRWEVVYVGGTDGAPSDVKQACLQWVSDIYNSRGTEGMKSYKIGDISWTRDDVASQHGMPASVKMILDNHRIIAI